MELWGGAAGFRRELGCGGSDLGRGWWARFWERVNREQRDLTDRARW